MHNLRVDARRVLVYTTEFLPLAWAEPNRERNTLLVQSPSDYLKQFYFYEYVREREEWSASIGRTSIWEDTNPWVGALATRLTKLPLSMTASTVRTMWNKLWIGTNRTKTKGLTPAQEQFLGRCEFCGADNQDEDHLIRHCPAPAFAAIRTKLDSDITTLIRSYPTSPTPCRQFARAIRDMAYRHSEGSSIWTGLWRDSILDTIGSEAKHGPTLSYMDARLLKKVLNEVGRCFCYATSEINNARQRAPMTTQHIQTLQNTYPEFTMYYPMITKRSQLPRYRHMSRDQRLLSRQPFTPPPSTKGLSKRQQKDRIRNHLAAHETSRASQMLALAQQPSQALPKPQRKVPNPHRLRHKSQPRRHAPRTQHLTVLAQAPAAPAAPVIALGSAVPPAHIARIQENTKRVRFFLPVPAAPPREGVG